MRESGPEFHGEDHLFDGGRRVKRLLWSSSHLFIYSVVVTPTQDDLGRIEASMKTTDN